MSSSVFPEILQAVFQSEEKQSPTTAWKKRKGMENSRKGKYWVNIRKMNNDSAEISISPGIQIYVHMKFMATII